MKRYILVDFGKAEVALVKISGQESRTLGKRNFAIAKGKVTASPDAFSERTEQNIASLMLDG